VSDPTDEEETPPEAQPGHGTLIRVRNGDAIRYEPSGLTLRLSDRVIADIALRLDLARGPTADAPDPTAPPAEAEAVARDALADVDAWGIVRRGDWLHFSARLPGAQGTRGFRRHVSGGAILGDGPGPIQAILGLGGPRAALASPGASAFPYHVVARGDDIGPVGQAGVGTVARTDRLEPLRECTLEALTAEALLSWRLEAFAPLPLFFVRSETAACPTAAEFARGRAVDNLLATAENLRAAAAHLGVEACIAAICLAYDWDHVEGDAAAYRDGMLATMARVEAGLAALGFDRPRFLCHFEAGLDGTNAAAVVEGQWELAWNHGAHRLTFAAPAAMFARDRFERLTDNGRREMAEMTAAALAAGPDWHCPTFLLAEREPGAADTIRVVAKSLGDLALADGAADAFTLTQGAVPVPITDLRVAPDDPKALLISHAPPAGGGALTLGYGLTGAGGVHDGWQMVSATGRRLHREALPCRLPVQGGAKAGSRDA
jgi:hypothetical protein